MSIQTNQSLSVDCVLFGFDGTSLRVLLIERPAYNNLERMKLPGSMIHQSETMLEAAVRVLESVTGMKIHYLKQLEKNSPSCISKSKFFACRRKWLTGKSSTKHIKIR